MPSKLVHVELDRDMRPIRIFRTGEWRNPDLCTTEMDRAGAVASIRHQVFERAATEHILIPGSCWMTYHACERCGRDIAWATMEMHEVLPKGKGGEVSLENCEALCHRCHTGSKDSAHGDRRWHTAKSSPEGTS